MPGAGSVRTRAAHNLMGDAATAEVRRVQNWQWIHNFAHQNWQWTHNFALFGQRARAGAGAESPKQLFGRVVRRTCSCASA